MEDIIAAQLKCIANYAKDYDDESDYGTNESLRVGKVQSFENLYGVQGSFRYLNID